MMIDIMITGYYFRSPRTLPSLVYRCKLNRVPFQKGYTDRSLNLGRWKINVGGGNVEVQYNTYG